uniref:D-isomer specific 2-hydroxyacid dehydrogenase NAD-binding domain-containing protein n=1 Tax=Clastoptera arizonana TaxID=38151 RepID=A0A1B6E629_9HEMI
MYRNIMYFKMFSFVSSIVGKSLECEFVSQDYLLQESDFIIISCTFTKETKHLFNRETFKKMKPSSILINVSRGGVVDQEALIEALINKTIWGAGLDVMTPEPLPHDHPLTKLPNCVLAPHLGTATERAEENMAVLAAQNIYNALNNLPLLTPIL